MGDVIHALPVLPFLKSADPGLQVDWLVEEPFASLLQGHDLIRQVYTVHTKRWRQAGVAAALKGAKEAVHLLRSERYDVVLDLQGNSKSGLFTRLTGAHLRFGFDKNGVREWPNLLATNRKIPIGKGDYHISDQSLAIAIAAFPRGSDVQLAGPLSAHETALDGVSRRLGTGGLSNGPVVVLHHGTTWKTKLWPLEMWGTLARALCDEWGLSPVLTWGNDEEHRSAIAIHEATGGRSMIWPKGGLKDLTALLQLADLVVGCDTGPIHIAAALGTPTVSLYLVTDSMRNGPRGGDHYKLQSPLDCSPCLKKECDRIIECGESIAVPDVLEAIGKNLGKKLE